MWTHEQGLQWTKVSKFWCQTSILINHLDYMSNFQNWESLQNIFSVLHSLLIILLVCGRWPNVISREHFQSGKLLSTECMHCASGPVRRIYNITTQKGQPFWGYKGILKRRKQKSWPLSSTPTQLKSQAYCMPTELLFGFKSEFKKQQIFFPFKFIRCINWWYAKLAILVASFRAGKKRQT